MVLAPEHPATAKLIDGHPERAAIETWIDSVRNQSNLERQEAGKVGHFTGKFAMNPFTSEEIPIWLGNFVLMQYGTGAIMSVPAHDDRDLEFAQQYGLPVRAVVDDDTGRIVNSGLITGLTPPKAIDRIIDEIERLEIGKRMTRYRLRDWLISRQRYWGTPIPMIYCPKDGLVPVPEGDLPVELPLDVPFTGREGNPLAKHEAFVNVNCPQCGSKARRETDTMDTFVDSSWYYARFISAHDNKQIFDSKLVDRWLPVDQYIGGIEHAILHLLYARFICRAMHDLGLTVHEEPFTRLFNQGVITKEGFRDPTDNLSWVPLIEVEMRNGKPYRGTTELVSEVGKMSKSRFNVVPPDELIRRYGADTERVYTLFIAPPEKEAAWSDEGVVGASRFLNRVWQMGQQIFGAPAASPAPPAPVTRKMHQTIDAVTRRFDRFEFNTAISSLMEFSNVLGEHVGSNPGALRQPYLVLLKLLHPFAPHMTEELWAKAGEKGFILTSQWPAADAALMQEDVVTIVIQVNGKRRGQIEVPHPPEEAVVMSAVQANDKVQAWISGKEVVKTIYVPGKLVNVVVR